MADIDKKIEQAMEPIVKMYSELETELMVLLAKHFKINEEFINSDFLRIQKLDEMGAFNKEVIDYISRYTKRSPSKIKKALKDVYNANIDFDTLRSAYDNGKILINPTEILNDTTLVGIMRYAYNVETKRFIEISKLIESSVRKTYLDIVEKSYLATSTGVKSYGETIRESLNELANKGIKTLNYISKGEDGTTSIRSYDVEGTVRREILTATRQLSGNLNHELIELTESKYIKFSEHLDCRPTHYDWQGTIARKEDWKDIADYGDVAGIYGINCRHYVEPYFQDADLDDTITIKDKDGNKKEYKVSNKLKEYSKDDTNDSYSISQKQRYLERGIRSWKRRREMSKASEDAEMLKKSKSKVKEWSDRLDSFADEHDRRRDFTREYVSSNNSNLKNITSNWLNNPSKFREEVKIFKNGEVFKYNGNDYVVDGHYVKYRTKERERNFANWLANNTGLKIQLNPEVEYPEGISVADISIFRKDKLIGNYDMKIVTGKSNQLLFHNVENKEKQSTKFLFEATDSPLSLKELVNQVEPLFKNKASWIEEIGIKKDDKFIIFKNTKKKL